MKRPLRLHAVTPAKVNLGLEILGRRPDGYHEILTLMQAVSLYDRFEWVDTGEEFVYRGPEGIDPEDDLVARALSMAPDRRHWTGQLRLVKHIPLAAGLGGGSSDAALALRLAFPPSSCDELSRRAAELGSDVPFFLRGGAALARGTGTKLVSLPVPRLWFVLVIPPIFLQQKTARMYSALRDQDFSNGATVNEIVDELRQGRMGISRLPNAFARHLLQEPVMRYAYESLERAGGTIVAISGAGPTMFAVARSYVDAVGIVTRLQGDAANAIGRVEIVRSIAENGGDVRVGRIADAMRGRTASSRH